MKKIYMVVIISSAIGLTMIIFWRGEDTWSNDDYQACVDIGGSTQESNPPTCFHPNGDSITPGLPKK